MEQQQQAAMSEIKERRSVIDTFLRGIEHIGNRLPDPVILFLGGLITVWILSAIMSTINFDVVDPRTGKMLVIDNLLTGTSLISFLSGMVTIFTSFPPLGIVLVAMMGVGVAERSGYINTAIRSLLKVTPKQMLTPILTLAALLSHTAVDAGYVLVIPLGGVMFHAAGRHPLAGIAAAFAGVSGGFAANFIPGPLDPLLQSFTQSAAQILNPAITVNPLCNYFFTTAASILIVSLSWLVTDRFIEPRLASVPFNDESAENESMTTEVTAKEKKAFFYATLSIGVNLLILFALAFPTTSLLRAPDGGITSPDAPLMKIIVPLIFLLFVIPGIIYGYMSRSFKSAKDVVYAMVHTISDMGHYIVMIYFCALFIYAFSASNIGVLLSLKGAEILRGMSLPVPMTMLGIIFLCSFVNLFVGSASAKWAILAPIFVTMLMQVHISPDLTQAAYRVGDSSTNIITPLMPYFPLVIAYCQRYVKDAQIGTVVSMMLPYSVVFMIGWTLLLMAFWYLNIPLGISSSYIYP